MESTVSPLHPPTASEESAAQGEPTPEEFGELFEQHSNAIYNYCFRRTGEWSVAEDLTSAVFLEAWRKRGRVNLVTEPPLPWLYGVATNLLRNHGRTLRRFRTAFERLPAPEAEPDFADTRHNDLPMRNGCAPCLRSSAACPAESVTCSRYASGPSSPTRRPRSL